MSVPVWKRKLSSAEYVYQIYQLNIRLGEILVNKPQKYKANYTDNIIQTSLSALKHVQIADSIPHSGAIAEMSGHIYDERINHYIRQFVNAFDGGAWVRNKPDWSDMLSE